MPPVPPADLADLYTAMLDGRIRLVVWGPGDWAHCMLWQCPLPVAYFVDRSPPLWDTEYLGRPVFSPDRLRHEDPARTVVMIRYHLGPSYGEVTAFLEDAGPFRHIRPDLLDQAFRPVDGGSDDAKLARLRELVTTRTGQELARSLIDLRLAEDRWHRLAGLLAAARHRRQGNPRTAVLLLEQLFPGGAERQLCELAVGLQRRGWSVTVATLRPIPGPADHYLQRLRTAGVACLTGSPPMDEAALREAIGDDADAALALWHLPGQLTALAFAALRILQTLRPELMISYLDRPNVIGGVAAVLAGVPRILLSGRNLHPGHLPHLFGRQPEDFRELYRILAGLPGIALSANSRRAARSYAEWLDLPADRIAVVPNAVAEEALQPPPAETVARMRARMAPAGREIVLGVFRLSPEKQPDLFLRVLARLAELRPQTHGVVCGDGPLREALEQQAAELGLAGRITWMGVIDAVPVAMRAADVLLHTSALEGMPNVLMEAQALGLPLVCTRTGGSEEALAPELLPYAHAAEDLDALVADLVRLLEDKALRHRLAQAGKAHSHRHHSLDRLVAGSLAVFARGEK